MIFIIKFDFFLENFITLKELRKQKLEKLNESR
jgi:hypothetical protein